MSANVLCTLSPILTLGAPSSHQSPVAMAPLPTMTPPRRRLSPMKVNDGSSVLRAACASIGMYTPAYDSPVSHSGFWLSLKVGNLS